MQLFTILYSGIHMVGFLWGMHPVLSVMQNLFNGQFLFVLKFLGEVTLVFIVGWIIGTLLHLDKAYESDSRVSH